MQTKSNLLNRRASRTLIAVLLATGHEHEHYPEHWTDVGGPESGPQMSGHGDLDVYINRELGHCVVLENGWVVEHDSNYLEIPDFTIPF